MKALPVQPTSVLSPQCPVTTSRSTSPRRSALLVKGRAAARRGCQVEISAPVRLCAWATR